MFYFDKKIFSKKLIIFFLVFVFFLLSFQTVSAKSYSYDLINVKINVNQDSTFDVVEEQVFNYIGEYHDGWRSISLSKIDQISDVEVIDGETGLPMVYSAKRLDKMDPASWGRFTYYKENGAENIIWYYNLSDTTYRWIIRYKVHGGIGFYPDHDGLNWYIFDDYGGAIKEVIAEVMLPEEVDYRDVTLNAYRSDAYQAYFIDKTHLPDKKSFLFESKNFKVRERFWIEMGWPKGLVSQSAYWQDFIKIYIFYILAGLISIANFIFIIIHWYFREINPVGRGTIIPQYAPPENLRPAMAEVLLKEKVTDKGWSATVIDLAVRGFIKIKEDTADAMDIIERTVPFLILLVAIFLLGTAAIDNFAGGRATIGLLFIWVFIIFFLGLFRQRASLLFQGKIKEYFIPKNYILSDVEEADRSVLEDYEIIFLSAIFGNLKTFSTKAMKHASNARKRELYEAMEKLKEKLYQETTIDTGAFEIGVEKEKIGYGILAAAVFVPLFLLAFLQFNINISAWMILIYIIFLNALTFYVYMKYEARLSKKGFILKEDWLGFKMYLETAERYRMQNLTPETFEKYLPYAIIFGIEDKWGKAFETLNVQNPSWYSGAYVGTGFHAGGFSHGGGFSPAGFSTSFSSSFSSAFSSAGGAGSAGGGGGAGGGAGGGGGGGGGGAS